MQFAVIEILNPYLKSLPQIMTYILTKYLILNPKNKFNWIKFMGAGVTFDLNFFDNSKLIEFDN
jgi:hypothetical protein